MHCYFIEHILCKDQTFYFPKAILESANITLKSLGMLLSVGTSLPLLVFCQVLKFYKTKTKVICVIFTVSKSKSDLDLTCRLQSSFSPWAQEISCSHVEKRDYISPYLTLPNKEICLCNIPGISEKTFLAVVDQLNYYCHLSQPASWWKKIHCHVTNDREMPSLFLSQEFSWYRSEKIHIWLNKRYLRRSFTICLYMCCCWKSYKPVYPCHSFCAAQTKIWIYNTIPHCLFCVQWTEVSDGCSFCSTISTFFMFLIQYNVLILNLYVFNYVNKS